MPLRQKAILSILVSLFVMLLWVNPALAQKPKVRAVLFYSPTCPHCHKVMEEDLPPLIQKYGSQLEIVGIDVTHEVGANLYQAMLYTFNVPDDRIGVPTLVVGDNVLVGSYEIPEQFPSIIENGLAAGGIDWPAIPGLQEVLAAQPSSPSAEAETQESGTSPNTPAEARPLFVQRFLQDPLANTIAVIVLIGMVASIFLVAGAYLGGSTLSRLNWPSWVLPTLSLAGIGVAAYLSYVEISRSEAVCGPVGNCNAVQESPYAYLFGVIPVGILGLLGYLLILTFWWLRQFRPNIFQKSASLALWGLSWFGVLFSIYLTFLEPFVIGATCAWCLASAVIMTLIFLASSPLALEVLNIDEKSSEELPPPEEIAA